MHLANGAAPMSNCFGYLIGPYTLQTDKALRAHYTANESAPFYEALRAFSAH